MGMGRWRRERQAELFVAAEDLPQSDGHPFYRRLNGLLAEAGFDDFVEGLCRPFYVSAGPGRDSIAPGVYFRMLFVGYFEGLDSQRAIAWRCGDSLSLRTFLGVALHEAVPDHSTLSKTRERLPHEAHERVFQFVLKLGADKGLLVGKTVGVDATTLEANAAMRSIVRKDTGEGYQAYLKRLAQAAGLENPTAEELRRFDKKRKGKTCSNDDWQSPADPEAEITKLKDGRTHLAYKAEHVVDLDSELLLAAEVRPATAADGDTMLDSVLTAQGHLEAAANLAPTTDHPEPVEAAPAIAEVAADKGYHKAETLAQAAEWQLRTYIPEQQRPDRRRWTDKPAGQQQAVSNNRRRVKRAKGKRLQRRRSEKVERSFQHVCDSGGARRTWLRGLTKVAKRYLLVAAAYNLGVVMRKLFGVGKPRRLQGLAAGLGALFAALANADHALARRLRRFSRGSELQHPWTVVAA